MLRVATYNIKHASLKGLDAVVRTLAPLDADLLAIQEVDVGVARSGAVDQAALLGERLERFPVFGPAFLYEGGRYGVVLLSRFPVLGHAVVPLPSRSQVPLPDGSEPRVLLDVSIGLPAGLLGERQGLRFLVTHFGLDRAERRLQADALLSHLGGAERTLVAGDLNEGPGGPAFTRLCELLIDCEEEARLSPRATYPSALPSLSIDHLLRSRDLPAASSARRLASEASDHLPVVLELG